MKIGNIQFNGGAVAITSVIVVLLMIVISGLFVLSGVTTMSPEVYFHVEDEVMTNVTVRIEGGVTKAVPEVHLGKEVTWEDVRISEDGRVHYRGKEYPFLYYEGVFNYPESYFGWLFERTDQGFFLDGSQLHIPLSEFIMDVFIGSGLYENEANYILERLLSNDMLEMSGDHLMFRYIPMDDVDETIELSTSFDFSIMRRHFVIQECQEPVEMVEPEFESVEDSGYIIHEIAINRF